MARSLMRDGSSEQMGFSWEELGSRKVSGDVTGCVGSSRQNAYVERWIGSARRDLLDHVIVLDENHLLRLLREYVTYYHNDRTHLGLGKDTPMQRGIEPPDKGATILALPRVGGLHHRYTRKAA